MASSRIALRKATGTCALFTKVINPVRSSASISPSCSRYFTTDTQVTNVDVDRSSSDDGSLSRRRDTSPSFFPLDAIDPFSPTRTLSQVYNLMDQLMGIPSVTSPGSGAAGVSARRGWDVKEDDNALYLKLDMPGLSKEDVKVCVEHDTLIIKGEGPKEYEEDESGRRYSSRLQLSPHQYKVDEIKAEMKNGVLKVVVPRVKEEERKDVHDVKIE